jgi:hypothetical protein
MKDLGIGEKEIGLDAHSKLLHRWSEMKGAPVGVDPKQWSLKVRVQYFKRKGIGFKFGVTSQDVDDIPRLAFRERCAWKIIKGVNNHFVSLLRTLVRGWFTIFIYCLYLGNVKGSRYLKLYFMHILMVRYFHRKIPGSLFPIVEFVALSEKYILFRRFQNGRLKK